MKCPFIFDTTRKNDIIIPVQVREGGEMPPRTRHCNRRLKRKDQIYATVPKGWEGLIVKPEARKPACNNYSKASSRDGTAGDQKPNFQSLSVEDEQAFFMSVV